MSFSTRLCANILETGQLIHSQLQGGTCDQSPPTGPQQHRGIWTIMVAGTKSHLKTY